MDNDSLLAQIFNFSIMVQGIMAQDIKKLHQ